MSGGWWKFISKTVRRCRSRQTLSLNLFTFVISLDRILGGLEVRRRAKVCALDEHCLFSWTNRDSEKVVAVVFCEQKQHLRRTSGIVRSTIVNTRAALPGQARSAAGMAECIFKFPSLRLHKRIQQFKTIQNYLKPFWAPVLYSGNWFSIYPHLDAPS